MEARPFGRMLLDLNIITEEQLEKAIQLQTKGGDTRPLGEVLLHLGYIDEKTLNTVLQVQSRHVRVDKVDAAFDRDDLEQAIANDGLMEIL